MNDSYDRAAQKFWSEPILDHAERMQEDKPADPAKWPSRLLLVAAGICLAMLVRSVVLWAMA